MGQGWLSQPGLSSTMACQAHSTPFFLLLPLPTPSPCPPKVPLGSSLLLLLGAARVSPYQYQPVHSGEPNIRGALNLYTIEDRA